MIYKLVKGAGCEDLWVALAAGLLSIRILSTTRRTTEGQVGRSFFSFFDIDLFLLIFASMLEVPLFWCSPGG